MMKRVVCLGMANYNFIAHRIHVRDRSGTCNGQAKLHANQCRPAHRGQGRAPPGPYGHDRCVQRGPGGPAFTTRRDRSLECPRPVSHWQQCRRAHRGPGARGPPRQIGFFLCFQAFTWVHSARGRQEPPWYLNHTTALNSQPCGKFYSLTESRLKNLRRWDKMINEFTFSTIIQQLMRVFLCAIWWWFLPVFDRGKMKYKS